MWVIGEFGTAPAIAVPGIFVELGQQLENLVNRNILVGGDQLKPYGKILYNRAGEFSRGGAKGKVMVLACVRRTSRAP